MSTPSVVLLVNLLQDVNILRPLAYIAARDLGLDTHFLVTQAFRKRDTDERWWAELNEIAKATVAKITVFEAEADAQQFLQTMSGVIVAASESNLRGHAVVHNVFRLKPDSFVSITLQHGFECVGFLQSRQHDLAHGRHVTFGADIVCGWCEPERLTSLAPSQQSKLVVTGPTAILQQNKRSGRRRAGIVCENLHSVRLNISGDFKADFVEIFGEFCDALASKGKDVVLRPHPGGQYMVKNDIALPDNAVMNNHPIYKVNLSQYAYGISAPSSVLIDMVLAGIPTAVWREGSGVMDADNYAGLTQISSVAEWLQFERDATANPQFFIEKQSTFLHKQKMLTDPSEVYRRYAMLLWSAVRRAAPAIRRPLPAPVVKHRLLFIANSYLPTLQLSFVKPLAPFIKAGEIETDFLTAHEFKRIFKQDADSDQAKKRLRDRLSEFEPTTIIFCRYSGPRADYVTDWAKQKKVPVIFHIDDDLLNIPKELGEEKHAFHNHPARIATVRHLLNKTDLVYCSNENLKERMQVLGAEAPLKAGKIYASGNVISPSTLKPVTKFGYMASADHAHNLALIQPALIEFMRRNPHVTFELFGSIPKPVAFDEFGDRVVTTPPVKDYENFLVSFACHQWDIGICPLVPTPFNVVKSNTKWVEYTSVGAAVIASRDTVYNDCCADDCGILADSHEEWLAALELLARSPERRYQQVKRAQQKLERDYSTDKLREQVFDFLATARSNSVLLKPPSAKRRLMFVASSYLPTLQLSFVKPLAPLVEAGEIATDFITEEELKETFKEDLEGSEATLWLDERLAALNPTAIVFCRYSGPNADYIISWARQRRIPVIFHVDDDLLNIPFELGARKHALHNNPARLATVRHLLDNSDLVYCSTTRLKNRFIELGAQSQLYDGKIYASGSVMSPAANRNVSKIGYMGFDHAHDLETMLPALVSFLRRNPGIQFELFGSIPKPGVLDEFGDRIIVTPPIRNYEAFLEHFASLDWDIGICPLAGSPFNLVKANTKWIEYTAVGAAVVATRDTVYNDCCADGCGILASTEDEWLNALERLVTDPTYRYEQVQRAQLRLEQEYSTDRLREQVLAVLETAQMYASEKNKTVVETA